MFEHSKSLAVFATVADVGSFRGAAKRLNMSPAAISGHVSLLEERFGVALMYRSTRKLTLTDIGHEVAQEGRNVLDASQSALDLVETRNRAPRGTLNISAPSWLQKGRFVEDISDFAAEFPDTKINLTFSDLRPDLIGEGIDLALSMGPIEDSSLKCRRLHGIREILVASPSYLEKMPDLNRPKDLEHHWFITYPAMRKVPYLIAKAPKVKNYPNPVLPSRLCVETRHFAYKFALRGNGIAILPDLLARDQIASGELVEVLPDWQLEPTELLAIWPANAGKWSPAISMSKHLVAKLNSYSDNDAAMGRQL